MSGENEGGYTPGPWKWQGEDYRGGWGWQILVGRQGEGIACGQGEDGGVFSGLKAHQPIDPALCKTGMMAEKGKSAPPIHVRQADARLIAAAPDLLEALQAMMGILPHVSTESGVCCCGDSMENHADPMSAGHSSVDSGHYAVMQWQDKARSAIARALGTGEVG